jgi:hypothetical protein
MGLWDDISNFAQGVSNTVSGIFGDTGGGARPIDPLAPKKHQLIAAIKADTSIDEETRQDLIKRILATAVNDPNVPDANGQLNNLDKEFQNYADSQDPVILARRAYQKKVKDAANRPGRNQTVISSPLNGTSTPSYDKGSQYAQAGYTQTGVLFK